MKTILKSGLLAAAAALALAGCNNAIGTEPAKDSFAYNADQYYEGTQAPFKVSDISVTKYSDMDKHRVTVTFSEPVTKAGIEHGVSLYKLENAANNLAMPKKTALSAEEVQVVGKEAYFTISTKDVKHLYMYVTADKVQAANGAKLNMDGDDKWGEAGDDDVAYHQQLIATAPALVGNKDYEHKLWTSMNDYSNATLSAAFTTVEFKAGESTKADGMLVKTVEVSASSFKTFLDTSEQTNAATLGQFLNEFAGLLNTHLKVDQYNWEKGTWEPVSVNFSTNTAKDAWVSAITVTPNRELRARLVDADKIKMSGFKNYGYTLKYSLKNNDPKIVGITPAAKDTGTVSLRDGDIWPASDVKKEMIVAGATSVTITFTPTALGSGANVFTANKWVTVTANNAVSGKASLFAGFEPATVTKDNFKCFITKDGQKVPLIIKDVTVLKGDITTYPHAFNKIVLTFDTKVDSSTQVYISPNVRTKTFKGSYTDGGLKPYDVPSLCFAKYNTSDDPEELGGWREVTN